jgi:hypothetical protein
MSRKGNRSGQCVRIPTHELRDVELRHMVSKRDCGRSVSAGAKITGLTEWAGSWCNRSLSIGWDWAVIDGIAVLVSPHEIRTNIELVGRDGRPAPLVVAQIYLVHWIETVPWRSRAIDELLATDCESRRRH